jgi:crotonobetainyl-CoA:carnitine CoA-transferase CaiB-like acyl-CoA transferase
VWAVAQEPREVAIDPQALANGYVQQVKDGHGRDMLLVANPVQMDGEVSVSGPAPDWGEHTDTVLVELGYTWDEIVAFKIAGAIL